MFDILFGRICDKFRTGCSNKICVDIQKEAIPRHFDRFLDLIASNISIEHLHTNYVFRCPGD